MKISQVLYKAANEHLLADSARDTLTRFEFGCPAVAMAAGNDPWHQETEAHMFLFSLGMGPGHSHSEFHEFKTVRDRQGVRYAWLMLAAMIAEEEGR